MSQCYGSYSTLYDRFGKYIDTKQVSYVLCGVPGNNRGGERGSSESWLEVDTRGWPLTPILHGDCFPAVSVSINKSFLPLLSRVNASPSLLHLSRYPTKGMDSLQKLLHTKMTSGVIHSVEWSDMINSLYNGKWKDTRH